MSRRDTAALACRILSVYAVVVTLISIPQVVSMPIIMRNIPDEALSPFILTVSVVVPFAFEFILALLLWYLADWLASFMISAEQADETITFNDLMTISFSMVGLYFLWYALPKGIGSLIMYIETPSLHFINKMEIIAARDLIGLIVYAVIFAASIILVFGARRIVTILDRGRSLITEQNLEGRD